MSHLYLDLVAVNKVLAMDGAENNKRDEMQLLDSVEVEFIYLYCMSNRRSFEKQDER